MDNALHIVRRQIKKKMIRKKSIVNVSNGGRVSQEDGMRRLSGGNSVTGVSTGINYFEFSPRRNYLIAHLSFRVLRKLKTE